MNIPSYFPNYVTSPDWFAGHLLGLPWLTKREARHEYFMATEDREYAYDPKHTYDSVPFTAEVNALKDRINEEFGTKHNVCFLNKYDNEKQHLGWHADNFPGMDPADPISVVPVGAEREIWFREQGLKGKVADDERQTLGHGSLWVMPPGYQDTHFHRIPKHDRPCGYRISLTFRSFK